ncbi:MAG: copper resistance protein B [Pseudomonadota bacterium]
MDGRGRQAVRIPGRLRRCAAAALLLGAGPAWAQDAGTGAPAGGHAHHRDADSAHADHAPETGGAPGAARGMDHGDMDMQGGSAPPDARDPHAYSGGYTRDSGPYVLQEPGHIHMGDAHGFGSLLIDRLERSVDSGTDSTHYDVQAWFGRTYDRLVLKAEGGIADGDIGDARTELLWGHAIAAFWDAQLGARHDSGAGPDRDWLAFGVQGLAPYWFEVEVTAYLGENGRTALRAEAEYDLLLTQRLVLQPRAEASFHGRDDAGRGLGSGLSDISAGLRLRYELRRELAPYIGIEHGRVFGQTRDFVRAAGQDADETHWLAGVRFWF